MVVSFFLVFEQQIFVLFQTFQVTFIPGLNKALGYVSLKLEFFALEGLSQLLQTVERVQQRFNPDLGILGVVLTMFDRRNRLTDLVSDDVRSCLGKLVFDATIPRNVRLSEAPSHGLPALIYDQHCPGSRAYIALAREMISRLPERRLAA